MDQLLVGLRFYNLLAKLGSGLVTHTCFSETGRNDCDKASGAVWGDRIVMRIIVLWGPPLFGNIHPPQKKHWLSTLEAEVFRST